MNPTVKQFTDFVIKQNSHNKATLIKEVICEFKLIKDRSVYYCDSFAVRFCQTQKGSFSNTVLAISALQKYDNIPFLVVLVYTDTNKPTKIYLANSTFINKVSHSSQHLSENNIRGSFNGSDIIKELQGITNDHEHIEELFAFHKEISWNENFSRILINTGKITPTGEKFEVNYGVKQRIYSSINRAVEFIKSDKYNELKNDLDQRVHLSEDAIICASHIENVNIRGRLIEALITADAEERKRLSTELNNIEKNLPVYDSKNELGDYRKAFDNERTLIDIKTKVIYLNSNPKAYNVDKFLEEMSYGDSVFFFYFIGINENSIINKVLCSVYHTKLIENTVVQHHWAGRNSRGVTQFIGKAIDEMINDSDFSNQIDYDKAKAFIDNLIDCKQE